MPTDAEALCLSCGLCCDGTLFTAVPLEPAEAVPLSFTTTSTGGRKLEQPCAGLSGCACTVYPRRPRACRQYRCLLLEALEADEVSLSDAQATLATLHARLRTLAQGLALAPPPPWESPIQRARRAAHAGTATPELVRVLEQVEEALRFHLSGHQRR